MKKRMQWMGIALFLLLLLPFSALSEGVSRITSWTQLENYLRDRAERRDTDFTFTYDTALNLHNRTRETSSLMQQSGMNSFQWEYTPGRIRVFNIDYSDTFGICRSKAEIRAYLAWCAQYQVKEFALFLGKSLYQEMKADHFSGMLALEGEARITGRNLSYSDDTCAFYYENTAYQSGAGQCENLSQVMDVLRAGVEGMQDEIHIFCSRDIYRRLCADGTVLLQEMLSTLGVQSYSYIPVESSGKITVTDMRHMAGHKILRAYRSGDYSGLTRREYDALVHAVHILNSGDIPSDLLGAEKWIHDFLCAHTVYEIDDHSDEDDCAIGALLNGRANCDGYADAFYLLGSLVGMEIRCQSGDSLRSDGEGGHMWNAIRLNHQWYMVDVTWNDSDEGNPAHIWYNLGADFARYSHTWQEIDGLDALAERTQNAYRPYPIFRCYTFDDLMGIMEETKGLGADRADIFYGYGQDLYADADRAYEKMRKGGVRGMIRSIWYDRPGFVHFYGLEY